MTERRDLESHPVSAATLVDLLQTPPTVSAAWRAFSLLVLESALHARAAFTDHALGLHISGRHRFRREISGRSVNGWSDPGTINLTPPFLEGTWDASGPIRSIVLFIPDAFLSRVVAEHWDADPRKVEIVPQFLVRDPVIESVMNRLALEAKLGSPSGQLYVESASEFLANHIVHSYSSLSKQPPRNGGLAGPRLKAVLEYINDSLAEPIALHHLARLAGVSVRHFERAFRQSVGMPPHAYVLEKRVAAARDLLVRDPRLTVAEIAAQSGFSSASHLGAAFLHRTGYSPAVFRRLHLR